MPTHLHHTLVVTLLAATATLVSCASYRLGSRPAGEATGGSTDQSVAVETVATPAEWGMDGARLTRTLIDLLADRGIEATWAEASSAAGSVRCSADAPLPKGFQGNRAARAEVRCEVASGHEDRTTVTAHGRAAAAAQSDPDYGPGAPTSAVLEEATIDALYRAAPQIADRLDTPETSPTGDDSDG
jgi:hypothetical protein